MALRKLKSKWKAWKNKLRIRKFFKVKPQKIDNAKHEKPKKD